MTVCAPVAAMVTAGLIVPVSSSRALATNTRAIMFPCFSPALSKQAQARLSLMAGSELGVG